jgi:putative membrane protein
MKSLYSARISFASIYLLSLVSLTAMLPVSAQSSTPTNTAPRQTQTAALNAVDRQFAATAAQSDLAEIQTSQLALKRSQNPQVLKYAREMIQMHTDSSNKLKPIATQLNVVLPKSLRAEDRSLVNRLQTLSGTQFDRVYINGQTQGHAKTQAAYQQELQQGQNAQLKAFASEILPVVTMHLQMARSLTARR